ncbi:hypothetical protein BC938DRAFT_484079 [Jimgerdemannia flammicorona]|uniref:Uncharacterized protein n=1 Tax=Jimgerdemannia flammicorona TaxID=994334 RepID=A0A433QAJ7_9FUNG|nr:hypothetical protein BC938DRAFT_484079 [Jimgerdemannia flammicorona]
MTNPSILSPEISKGLSNPEYSAQQHAAWQIEKLVRDDASYESINHIIKTLVTEFVHSTNPHARIGGLIALAATTTALNSVFILDQLVRFSVNGCDTVAFTYISN